MFNGGRYIVLKGMPKCSCYFTCYLYNLFTTSDPPNIRIPILQIFVFVIEGGQENIFLLVENIFWTNENVFLSLFNNKNKDLENWNSNILEGLMS